MFQLKAGQFRLVYFDVKNEGGKVVHWVAETGTPQSLSLIGWEKASLSPGDVITVYVYPSKVGTPAGRLNRLVMADGTELHDPQLGGAGDQSRYSQYDYVTGKEKNSK